MAVTGKSGKNEGQKPNRYRPFPKRGGMQHQPPMPFLPPPPWHVRQPKSSDDRHVMAKHASLYPSNLPAFQKMVSSCEKALKLVSDQLSTPQDGDDTRNKEENKEETETATSTEETETTGDKSTEEKEPAAGSSTKNNESSNTPNKKDRHNRYMHDNVYRSLKGVQRVGVFGHGVLLQDDTTVDLVALAAEKPTETLLQQIYDCIPAHLSTVTDEKYQLELLKESAAIMVTREKEPNISCRITLTSPEMRPNPEESVEIGGDNNGDHKTPEGANGGEEDAKKDEDMKYDENAKDEDEKKSNDADVCDPPDVLNKEICLEALAQLRRAKWFQARARGLPNCVIILRILRDLSKRVTEWQNLDLWAMELLVQKCIASVRVALGPGNALRRVLECLSAGLIMPSGHGLYDPCEREPTDPLTGLSLQDRENITTSAQYMLRLMAFRRIRKVLDMDYLPTQERKFKQRKRKRAAEGSGSSEANATEKKDRKDGQQNEEDAVAVDDDEEDELLEDEDEEDCTVVETTDA